MVWCRIGFGDADRDFDVALEDVMLIGEVR